MKFYTIFNTSGNRHSFADLESRKEQFLILNISSSLKNSIIQRVNAEGDFELTLSELQQLAPALSERIDELVVDPKFDKFKEILRRKNPIQFGSNPFTWKGVTYYLYSKNNPIDSEISRTNGFLELIQEFISHNKPLKYIYKNS